MLGMDDSDLLDFTPVPLRARGDGWTAQRQRAFILGLRLTRSVSAAAALLGMSRETAYRLRARRGAGSFTAAWDTALALPPLGAEERGTVVDGRLVPVIRRHRVVGWRRKHDDRALACLLRAKIARDGLEFVR
jgi:hypothetical protein